MSATATVAMTRILNKRRSEGLFKHTSLKSGRRPELIHPYEPDVPRRRVWPKIREPVSRRVVRYLRINSDKPIKASGETQVGATGGCWQCIFGYDMGATNYITIETLKMCMIGQEDALEHIYVKASFIDGVLHLENPDGLPTGPPSDELFRRQREFVSTPPPGCVKLKELLEHATAGTLVGGPPQNLIERVADDLKLPVDNVHTPQVRNAITELVNKRAAQAITKTHLRTIVLPNATREEVIESLNSSFGDGTFIRGSRPHHPHPYHYGSRKAVTDYIVNMLPRTALVYDIGGNPHEHLKHSHFNIHSVYSKSTAPDYARHIRWTKQCVEWARNVLRPDNSATNLVKSAAASVLDQSNIFWCSNAMAGCNHYARDVGFAMSVDTLFHVGVDELCSFYISHRIVHAVHALTIPDGLMYSNSGSLKHNEGHWYRNDNGTWTMEFVGESLAYTQDYDGTMLWLSVPLINLGEAVVYCKVGGYKGAHVIVEHYMLPRNELDKLYAQHVLWFNHNMDNLFVWLPVVNMDNSPTLLGREPFTLKQCMINVQFYERILNRLLQSYTWESTLAYASAMVGRVYATSSGLVQRWNLSNSEVREHCIVAYWTANRVNESIRPLINQANTNPRAPDFLTNLWNSIKSWLADFVSVFDPSASEVVQQFIDTNRGDPLRLTQMFGTASRSIESLNVATQMVNSRRITDWIATDVGVIASSPPPDIDTWRTAEYTAGSPVTVYDLINPDCHGDKVLMQTCTARQSCPHDHRSRHVHVFITSSATVARCVCCDVVSTVMPNGACAICSDHPPCHGKLPRCPHTHTVLNDECCSKPRCECRKPNQCLCCGLNCADRFCKVCNFNPRIEGADTLPSINLDAEQPPDKRPTPSSRHDKAQSQDKEKLTNTNIAIKPLALQKDRGATTNSASHDAKVADTVTSKPDVCDNLPMCDNGEATTTTNLSQPRPLEVKALPNEQSPLNLGLNGFSKPTVVTGDLGKHGTVSIADIPNTAITHLDVTILGYSDVTGDGRCGLYALCLAAELPIDSVSQWFIAARGSDEWMNSEELACAAMAFNKNIIMVEENEAILYRANSEDIAVCIIYGSHFGKPDHWVAGDVRINTYGSLYTIRLIDNYRELLRVTGQDGSVNSAYAYRYRDLDVEWIYSLGGKISVTPNGINVVHQASQPRAMVSKIPNKANYIVGPTGSGKTTQAHRLLGGKTLIITPSRSTVIGATSHLRNAGVSCYGRAHSQWYPSTANNNDILNSTVVIMTVESVYSGLFSDKQPNTLYIKLIEGRHIVCDEIHELTPHYARVLTRLPAGTFFASATLPGYRPDLRCQHDTTTIFNTYYNIERYAADLIQKGLSANTAVIVASKRETYQADKRYSITPVNSDTVKDIDITAVDRVIGTNCITTGVTLPRINTIIDTGYRYLVNLNFDYVPHRSKPFIPLKYEFSKAEMLQARGRVGRVYPGVYISPCPADNTPVSLQDEMMFSAMVGTPCSADAMRAWNSLSDQKFAQVQAHYSTLQDGSEEKDQLANWLAAYGELLQLKKSGAKLEMTGTSPSREEYISWAPSMLNTYKATKRIGAVRSQITIDRDVLLPAHILSGLSGVDAENLEVEAHRDDYLKMNYTDNRHVSVTMRKLIMAELLSTIKNIKFALIQSHNRGTAQDDGGQYPTYRTLDVALSKLGKEPHSQDIVGVVDSLRGTGTVTIFERAKTLSGLICIPTYHTYHYLPTMISLGQIADSPRAISDILSSSTCITGPPGSGKTTKMISMVSGGPIITTSRAMLDKNEGWLTPNQLVAGNTQIGIDEVGLMSLPTFIATIAKCDSFIATGDLAQITQRHDSTTTAVTGYTSTLELINKHCHTIKLDKSWRFGPATCQLLNKIAGPIEPANDTSDTITGEVINSCTKDALLPSILRHNPDIIITATNAVYRRMRPWVGINMYPAHKCQGYEADTVMVVLQSIETRHITADLLYVLFSRHRRKLVVIFDGATKVIAQTYDIQCDNLFTYRNALGGNLDVSTAIHNYIVSLLVDSQHLPNWVSDAVDEVMAAVDSGTHCQGERLLDRRENKYLISCSNYGPAGWLVSMDINGRAQLFRYRNDGTKYVRTMVLRALPVPKLLSMMFNHIFKRVIHLGSKAAVTVVEWCKSAFSTVGNTLVQEQSQVHSTQPGVGGAANVVALIFSCLSGAWHSCLSLIKQINAEISAYKWLFDGKAAGQALKVNLFSLMNVGGATTITEVVTSLLSSAATMLYDCFNVVVNTVMDIINWVKNVLDANCRLDGGHSDKRMAADIDQEAAALHEEIEAMEVLFDFGDVEKSTVNEDSTDHIVQAVNSSQNPEDDSTHNKSEGQQCQCERKLHLAGHVETSIDLIHFKPNRLGRLMMKRDGDVLSAKIPVPGKGTYDVTSTTCPHKHSVFTVKHGGNILFDGVLKRSGNGYDVSLVGDTPTLNMPLLEQMLKYTSSLGGASSPGFLTLIKNIIKVGQQFMRKMHILIKWRLKAISNQCSVESTQIDMPVPLAFRHMLSHAPHGGLHAGRYKVTGIGGMYCATVVADDIESTDERDNSFMIFIFGLSNISNVILFTQLPSNKYRFSMDYFLRGIRLEDRNVGGATSAIDNFIRLGFDIRKLLAQTDAFDKDKIAKWIVHNPLSYVFDVTTADSLTTYKEQVDTIHELTRSTMLSLPTKLRIAFCIPSGHGKTTCVTRLRRERPDLTVLDCDEVQEQAAILLLPFDAKMRSYRERIQTYINKQLTPPDILFCHMPECAPEGYKIVCIINEAAEPPRDRVWSKENMAKLTNSGRTIHHVQSWGELHRTVDMYIEQQYHGNLLLCDNGILIDNINSIMGDAFIANSPGPDTILHLPKGRSDRLSMREDNLGLGYQRIYQTGPHVDITRPTIQKMATSLPNAITTRLMGRQKLRTEDLSINQYHQLMKRFCIPDVDRWLDHFSDDGIYLTVDKIIEWLVNKGNKVELVYDMLKQVLTSEYATDPSAISVHFKVENLLKEQVNDVLDQIGRVIVWNNQNINMFACPVINEAKARLKLLLKDNVVYTDGMTIAELNNNLRTRRCRYLLEMDLSKQDRQTDRQILEYEWWLVQRLGVSPKVVSYMTSFMPTFTIRGTNNERAILPAIHFSGGAMTSLGNEIRNLLLISDSLRTDFEAIYTLGDDSLILLNSLPDLDEIARVCRDRHNVVNTATVSSKGALFLQLIITWDADGGLYASHNFIRLRDKLCYSPYPNWSSDWKMKYASYLMMIGPCDLTRQAMHHCGFIAFPELGTTMDERVHANAVYHNMTEIAVLNVVHDIVHLRFEESVEHMLHVSVVLPPSKMSASALTPGEYHDAHAKLLNALHEHLGY